MYFPKKSEFIKLSKQGSLIPVYREIIADTETPVSAFSKIRGRYSFLLESVEGGENLARYSFLGCDPYVVFSSKGDDISVSKVSNGKISKTERSKGNPFDHLEKLLSQYRPVKVENLPRFHGGAVGYAGYDMVRFIENIPDKNPDDLKLPDCQFLLTDTLLVFDHVKHKILVVSNARIQGDAGAAYEEAVKKIDKLVHKLRKRSNLKAIEPDAALKEKRAKITSNMSKKEFEDAVTKAKEYIRNGDIIQVVPSQRFKTKLNVSDFDVYRALRTINPSPYMYYFCLDDLRIVGTSPEIMVRLEDSVASIRPIAGTRPRGENAKEDCILEKELLADEKEKAEHIMLVDLARNDLGRVCKNGTVKVDNLMSVEKYSHVMHIVSNVSGILDKGKNAFDLFKACFPAGTVSGAPKIRAMEIIDELEKVKRGPYAGAVGYFDFAGNLDTCITIRTIVVKGKTAYIQAGGGVVADSVPENEYFESCNKAKAMLGAIEMVSK